VNQLRKGLPPLPDRMKGLPVDERGYPVPRFVEWIDGKPDFRVMSAHHFRDCIQFEWCWVCGDRLGRSRAYVIGPMCAVNRVSSEPPSHRECSIFAVTACPFLTRPKAVRREANRPEGHVSAGCSIPRNPGVALVWVTRYGKPFRSLAQPEHGIRAGTLFDVGAPLEVLWFAEGRPATRAEVLASIDSGLPELERLAQLDGDAALVELHHQRDAALQLLPPEAA
jgi:hypothetical protein